MSLEMQQDEVAINVIAVPGVMRLAAFILARRVFLAQQTVVFYVIGTGELPPCEHVVQYDKRNHDPAKDRYQSESEQGANGE